MRSEKIPDTTLMDIIVNHGGCESPGDVVQISRITLASMATEIMKQRTRDESVSVRQHAVEPANYRPQHVCDFDDAFNFKTYDVPNFIPLEKVDHIGSGSKWRWVKDGVSIEGWDTTEAAKISARLRVKRSVEQLQSIEAQIAEMV